MAEVGMGLSEELFDQSEETEEVEDESSGLPPDFEEVPEEEEPDADDEVGDSSEEEETAEDEEPEEEDAPKGSRAQRRIQDLVSSNKQLQQNLEQQQLQFQRQLASIQQQQKEQDSQYRKEQLELQKQQLEIERRRREREEESELTELEKFRRGIISEVKGSSPELKRELEEIKKQLEESKSAQQKAREEAERQRRVMHFSKQADAMLGDVVLKSVAGESRAKLDTRAKDVLMTYCAAYGVEPKDAAPQFKQFLDDYAHAVMQGRASSGKKAAKVAGAPASKMSPKAPKQKVSRAWPNAKQLRANNYDSVFDWVASGEPPLPPSE